MMLMNSITSITALALLRVHVVRVGDCWLGINSPFWILACSLALHQWSEGDRFACFRPPPGPDRIRSYLGPDKPGRKALEQILSHIGTVALGKCGRSFESGNRVDEMEKRRDRGTLFVCSFSAVINLERCWDGKCFMAGSSEPKCK